jgi:uncharacterized membrane protein
LTNETTPSKDLNTSGDPESAQPEEAELTELIEGIISEEKDPKIIAQRLSVEASSYRGPLPPPGDLAEYEKTLPGAADRIFKMAEHQAEHRQGLEKSVVDAGNARAGRGLTLGFTISLVVLGLGGVFVLTGHDWAGVSLMGTTLVSLAAVFVIGHRGQIRERVQKARGSGRTADPN